MIVRELGRFLTPGPFLSSSIGARVAAQAGHPALAVDIAGGARRVGMAVGDRVLDARAGELLLRLDAEAAVLAEIGDAEPLAALDPATRLVRVHESTVIGRARDPLLLSRGRVLAAAILLGITEAVRDMSAAYARTRVQFGRPIGAFQAVKHRCVDMAVAAYATVGQLHQAALYVEGAHPDAAFHAAAAYVLAARPGRVAQRRRQHPEPRRSRSRWRREQPGCLSPSYPLCAAEGGVARQALAQIHAVRGGQRELAIADGEGHRRRTVGGRRGHRHRCGGRNQHRPDDGRGAAYRKLTST
jgi:Acyl-CoA dehydrogenase, C-terminal domain